MFEEFSTCIVPSYNLKSHVRMCALILFHMLLDPKYNNAELQQLLLLCLEKWENPKETKIYAVI